MAMEPSKPLILEVPDAEKWKEFEANARKEWRKHHKKKSGRKSVADEAFAKVYESWLELRQGEMTQYKITNHAWKKNKKIKRSTYKKYTTQFVALLAVAADRDQLSANDRKLLENATPALAKRANDFKQAVANATTPVEQVGLSSHHGLAKGLAQVSQDLLAAIEVQLRKDALIPSE